MKRKSKNRLREIPSVDRVLRELGEIDLPRPTVLAVVREEISRARSRLKKNEVSIDLKKSIGDAITELRLSRIQPVINGTGVIVHTNFGRSPLARSAIDSLGEIAANYNNLEFDLLSGARSSRAKYLEKSLAVLCGAEAAAVVNNCAAALVLILRHFSSQRETIVSRGELIQIGGGFRIPEILEASGAVLREIGTTNKTSVADYSRAINKQTAMILKVHRSNFFMDGFVATPDTREIVAIARKRRILFVEDLGSGAMTEIDGEPTPARVLKNGVDLVTFSGDKLLGGPQAGIIAGRARLVAQLKRDPLFRALRCDKLVLSALENTVDLHLRGQQESIPIVVMMNASVDSMRDRGSKLIEMLSDLPLEVALTNCQSQIGGGALPRASIASIAIEMKHASISAQDFAQKLRLTSPPIVGIVERGKFKLDLRTIFPAQDQVVAQTIRAACA